MRNPPLATFEASVPEKRAEVRCSSGCGLCKCVLVIDSIHDVQNGQKIDRLLSVWPLSTDACTVDIYTRSKDGLRPRGPPLVRIVHIREFHEISQECTEFDMISGQYP